MKEIIKKNKNLIYNEILATKVKMTYNPIYIFN